MQHLLTYFTKLENNNMAQRKIFLCDDVNDESLNSRSQVCISPRTNTSIVVVLKPASCDPAGPGGVCY